MDPYDLFTHILQGCFTGIGTILRLYNCPSASELIPKDMGTYHDSKVHGAYMGPIWGRQDPGGPHVGPINFTIWVTLGYG